MEQNKKQYWLCDKTDEAWLLSDISCWSVGCLNEQYYQQEIQELKEKGHITERRHYFLDGTYTSGYLLTKEGLNRLYKIGELYQIQNVLNQYAFYLANTKKILDNTTETE